MRDVRDERWTTGPPTELGSDITHDVEVKVDGEWVSVPEGATFTWTLNQTQVEWQVRLIDPEIRHRSVRR